MLDYRHIVIKTNIKLRILNKIKFKYFLNKNILVSVLISSYNSGSSIPWGHIRKRREFQMCINLIDRIYIVWQYKFKEKALRCESVFDASTLFGVKLNVILKKNWMKCYCFLFSCFCNTFYFS